MSNCTKNGIQYSIEVLPDIFGQETQHEAAVFLQESIFPPVTPVSVGVSQMLWTIQFNGQVRFRAIEVNFHFGVRTEPDW